MDEEVLPRDASETPHLGSDERDGWDFFSN
jgi:hypothetical protein